MKNSPNCQAIQKNIKKLKNLKQDFLLEMERIKKDGKTGRIFELKSVKIF